MQMPIIPNEAAQTLIPESIGIKMLEKKKPEMLKLKPKGNMFGDETPTPTRFLRNCEEVGLFQDLHNVNPFEETFLKALTNPQPPPTEVRSGVEGDDTLHTPNVFPLLTEPRLSPPESPPKSAPLRKYNRKRKVGRRAVPLSQPAENAQFVVVNRHVTFKLPIPRLPVGAKVYRPNYFSTFAKNANAVSLNDSVANKANDAQSKFKDSTKSQLMERNRVAAMRTREKKKHYVAHLEKMKNMLMEKTIELEHRVKSLSSENLGLKERLTKCQCCTDVTVNTEMAASTGTVAVTNDMEKQVFYDTIPTPLLLRKPFKKRNVT